MPGDMSTAVMGRLGNRVLRVVVRTPVPQPLSSATAEGAERGDLLWVQDIRSEAIGRVMDSARAAYCAEAEPQSSDESAFWDLDMMTALASR